jgi:hypothetical protein
MKEAVLNFTDPIRYKDKKTNSTKRLSDNIFRDFKLIPRANYTSKKLSLKARNLLTNLFQMIQKSPHKEIFVDHKFLSKKTEVDSSKQNARLLYQISDIIDSTYHNHINFHGKYLSYGYVIKLTENGYEKATNPEKFYSVSDGQKCLSSSTKMSTQMDKNVDLFISKQDTLQEVEEIAYGYISSTEEVSILIKSTARAQETENTTCSNAILAEHSQVAIPESKEKEAITICDQTDKPKLLNASEKKPNTPEEISIMKPEEPTLSDKETRKMLLSKAIFDAFGETTANEIQDNCTFEELAPDKVGIKPGVGVSFNDIEKAKIRRCIKAVYGEEVKILVAIPTPMVTLAKTDNESGLAKGNVGVSVCQNPQWLCLRSNLHKAFMKRHEGKYAEHIVKNWFDKLSVSHESRREKLILIGETSVIHRIYEEYISATEQAVLDSNFEVELRYEGNRERPIILTKEMINRGK